MTIFSRAAARARAAAVGALLVASLVTWAPAPAGAQFRLETFRNNATTTLSTGISSGDTSITVADGSLFPSPTGGQYFWLTLEQSGTIEIVKVEARSGNTLSSITRGQQSTSAAAFTSGANVYLPGVSRQTLEDIQSAIGAAFVVTGATSHLANEVVTGTNVATAIAATLNGAGGLVSTDGSATLTNKTLDVEATGNAVTVTAIVPYVVAACQNGTAALAVSTGATAPTAVCATGSNTVYGVAQFPDTDGAYDLFGSLPLPADWAGAVDLSGKYRASGTSGNVVFSVSTVCVADGETGDPSFNTAQDVTDALKGTTLQWNDFSQSSLTTTGCAAGETLVWRLRRQRTHASDTATGTIDLLSLAFTLRRAL